MEFSLPGQLRGPECKPVMPAAIELRRLLEPWFRDLRTDRVAKLTVVLRVDGSLVCVSKLIDMKSAIFEQGL
jgi:hypothetical protein